MNLQIKNYKDRDMEEILNLFKSTFNREMSEKYWKWRYHENLLKEKYIKLMWDENVLAGHYAVFPIELKIGSDIKKTGFSMTTMTSNQYRKLGIFNNLAKSLYDDSFNDLELIWGFPNDNSLHGFVKYLDWEIVKDIPMYEINIDSFKVSEVNNNIISIDNFSKKYDGFFDRASKIHSIIVKKDSKYLNWRYIYNPNNKYYAIEYKKEELLGFCVYKLYKNEGTLNGYIIDILALNDKIFYSLISKAIDELKLMGAKNAYIWMNDTHYLRILKDMKFKETQRLTHFGCRLNSDKMLDTNIYDFNNWYLMMGDSDVF